MAKVRRYLVIHEVAASGGEEFAAKQEARFAASPAAAQYSDEEAEDFLSAAHYLDSLDQPAIVKGLRRAHIAFPPDLAFDEYRLGRHLLRRWREEPMRQWFRQHGLQLNTREVQKLLRHGNPGQLLPSADRFGAHALFSALRQGGMAEVIPGLKAAFSPQQDARYRALLLCGKVLMHRFLTEPEPARQPSRWEQQRLIRRIRLREVQLRAMQQSVHKLRRERKALLSRLREIGRAEQPELDRYTAELRQIRAERAEAERRHAAALAEQAGRHREAIARLQQELAAAKQDYSETLALRTSWLSLPRRR